MARWTASTAIAALLLVVSPARAQHVDPRDGAQPGAPPIDQRKHFVLDFKGVPGCGERALFEDALRIQMLLLGSTWNPFAPVSPLPLKVRITRSNGWYDGVAEVYGPDGGTHAMPGPLTCYDVIAGLTSALATDATPLVGPRPKPPVRSEPPLCPTCLDSRFSLWPAEPLRAPEPDPPKPHEPDLRFRFGVGAWADLISNDRGSLGLTTDVGVRYRWFSTAIEARGDPAIGSTPFSAGVGHGAMRFARVTGAALLCAHYTVLVGCLKGEAGRILFPASVPAAPAQLYGAPGLRIGLEWPVVPWFLVRLNGELLVPINPTPIVVGNQTVFQVAGWNAGLGLGAVFAVGKR